MTGESPLLVLPGLACEVGLPESVFLQQLHYWLDRGNGHERDGHQWVFNSYDDWHKQFPFWSVDIIGRLVRKLSTAGLIEVTARFNQSATDQRRWYRIRYDAPCLAGLVRECTYHSAIPQNGNDAETEKAAPDQGFPILQNRRLQSAESHAHSAESQIVKGTETTTENNPPSSPPEEKPPKRATGIPESFDVTDEMKEQAVAYGVVADRIAFETEHFLDHHRAKGSTFKDWPAAWRTWMRNVSKYGGRAAKPKYEPNHPKNPRLFVG